MNTQDVAQMAREAELFRWLRSRLSMRIDPDGTVVLTAKFQPVEMPTQCDVEALIAEAKDNTK